MSDKRESAIVELKGLIEKMTAADKAVAIKDLAIVTYHAPGPFDTVVKEGYVKSLTLHLDKDPFAGTNISEVPDRQTYLKVVIGTDTDSWINPSVEFRLIRTTQSPTSVNLYQPLSLKVPLAVDWCSVSMAIIDTLQEALINKTKVKVTGICRRWDFQPSMDPYGHIMGTLYNELHTVELIQ